MNKLNSTDVSRPTSNKNHVVRLLASLHEERGALGAALLAPDQASLLLAHATIEDFTYESHRLIFEAMVRLGPPFDVTTLAAELERVGQLDRVSWGYLTDIDLGVVVERPMAGRLGRLRDLQNLRELRKLADDIHTDVHMPLSTAVNVIEKIRGRLEEITK